MQRSPLRPAPDSKTEGPGSPSQTPVHAAPSGTIEVLVPYTTMLTSSRPVGHWLGVEVVVTPGVVVVVGPDGASSGAQARTTPTSGPEASERAVSSLSFQVFGGSAANDAMSRTLLPVPAVTIPNAHAPSFWLSAVLQVVRTMPSLPPWLQMSRVAGW